MNEYQITLTVRHNDRMASMDREAVDHSNEIIVDAPTLESAFAHLVDELPAATRHALRNALDNT